MKYSITWLVALTGAAGMAVAPTLSAETHKRPSSPVVITPPAVPDGSNFSRAPFPAARPQNDVTPPNGEAFDQDMPPNTPSTTPAPEPPPPATIAILQPKTEPGLMPTGRTSVSATVALDTAQVEPAIRSATYESRDGLIDGLRTRIRESESTLSQFRRTENEMSAEGRSQFRSAADEVHARRKALDKSLRAAERASAADWDSARAQLVADYDAYAAAVTHVDSLVGVAPAQH
jgi:hypothetical protein